MMLSDVVITEPIYKVEVVQEIIANAANKITIEMANALKIEKEEGLNFKALADKFINPKLDEELSKCHEKTLMVFMKLFSVINEHIQLHSSGLKFAFEVMAEQTGTRNSSRQFLATFTLAEINNVVATLEKEQPKALNSPEIWK